MENIYSNFRSRRLRRKRRNQIRFFILVLISVLVVLAGYFKLVIPNKTNSAKLVSPMVAFSSSTNVSGSSNTSNGDIALQNVLEKAMQDTKGTYGIVIKNLKSGKFYFANEHKIFEAGSLYKLWIMATVYQQIQSGQLTKDQVLTKDIATLNQIFYIDPDLAEQTQGTITLTVQSALTQMITISHNYAALLLTEKIKLSSVATFLKENGFTQSTVGTEGDAPTVTPYDIFLFLEKLYKGELAGEQYTKDMIDLLRKQKLNDGLPKYLPNTLQVAHKTGEIGWFKHDAGIVFTDKGDYIIIVMSESESPAGAQERIALLSKAVFDYFQTN